MKISTAFLAGVGVLFSGAAVAAPPIAPRLPPPKDTQLCHFIPSNHVGPGGSQVYDVEPRNLVPSSRTLDNRFASQVNSPDWEEILNGYNSVFPDRWKRGWGAENDPPTVDTPFGRLLAAIALLNQPPAPGYEGVVEWADDYVKKASALEPSCRDSEVADASTQHLPPKILILAGGFNMNVYRRAAILVHETRHSQFSFFDGDWPSHNGPGVKCDSDSSWVPGQCCRSGASCDRAFEDWRPYSVHAAYLGSLARSETLREASDQILPEGKERDIAAAANGILRGKFAYDPGFRYSTGLGDPDIGLLEPLSGNEYHVIQEILPGTGEVSTQSTPMDDVSTHFCFLTWVQGQFQREAQHIRIDREPYSGGERWVLNTGTRTDVGLVWPQLIRGAARCLPLGTSTEVREYEIDHGDHVGETWTELEPADGETTCFLMGVGGAMQDSINGAYVTIKDGAWQVSTLSGHPEEGAQLSAKFGCIDAVPVSEHIRNYPGEFPIVCSAYETEPPNPGDAVYCGLTGVTGQFEGWEEYAQITPHGEVSETEFTPWRLKVGENRAFHTVFGYAGCFLQPGYSAPQVELCSD